MADLINSTQQNPSGCGHWTLGGLDDGQAWSGLSVHDSDLNVALSDEEKQLLRRLLLRRLRTSGVTLAQFLNRAIRGDEATNVKAYELLGTGVSITKTNIGTSYVNISPRLNGERRLVDFTGCTQYRLIANCNLVGTGAFGMRVVRDSDNAVLHENANIGAAGERELDTDWQTLPAAANGPTLVRVQAKSTTATDDPVFGGVTMLVR